MASEQVPHINRRRPGDNQTDALRAGKAAAEKLHPGGSRSVRGYSAEAEAAFWNAYRAERDGQGR